VRDRLPHTQRQLAGVAQRGERLGRAARPVLVVHAGHAGGVRRRYALPHRVADLSAATLELLEEHGFLYDSSLMADDYRPYRPRIGDRVSQREPLVRGRDAALWEIPMCFELDDWPHFQFNFDPSRVGLSAPSKVLEIWQGELDFMHEHVDGGVLVVTMHPQVIGRGHRVAMLERFVEHARGLGVEFAQMGEVANRVARGR
jgi:hypothetical protein